MGKYSDSILQIMVGSDNPDLQKAFKRLVELRKTVETAEPEETALRTSIIEMLDGDRDQVDRFIKAIELMEKDGGPKVTVSYTGKPEIPYDKKAEMAELFGPMRTVLFPYGVSIEITNPVGLIKEIVDAGDDPLDFIEVKFRTGVEKMFVRSPNVAKKEVLELGDKFFEKLNDNVLRFSVKAKEFLSKFIRANFEPVVKVKA